MKRGPSASNRAPSPTPTAFSGISNYRTDSYRPINGSAAPAVPSLDPRIIARTHFDELSKYLAAYLARAPANSRATARQKLTRLTRQQFQELSTDVYDELVRRKKNSSSENEVPFLPVRSDFHPKRNQARQKLATLPTSRFEDLSSDVYYELVRRYPEFKEEPPDSAPLSPRSAYDDYPSPDFNPASPRQQTPMRVPEDRTGDSGYGGSGYGRKASEGGRPSGEEYGGRRSEDTYSGRRSEDTYGGRRSEDAYGGVGRTSGESSRRKASQDTERRPSADDFVRRPSVSGSAGSENAQSATATSGMIIPNKSTIAEEEIEVPYGRERESSGTALDERERDSPGPIGGLSGLSGLRARLGGVGESDDEGDAVAEERSGDDYYDKVSFGRASVASDRSNGGTGPLRLSGAARGASASGEDQERLRREYEFKIATMQSKITGLERDLGDVEEREQKWLEGEKRVRQMEEELAGLRRRAEAESNTMRVLERELADLKEGKARRSREDDDELQILRDRCEQLEAERAGGGDAEIIDQLRSDMEGLLSELEDLSRRNDELMTAKDSDLAVIRNLDLQMKEYKHKYEQAKTELRSLKATSQLYLQAPKSHGEDQLPVSPDGAILDIHITAFLSGVDALLTAGRSNAPTRVLTPMKAIVNAVSAIVDDVRAFERRASQDRAEVDTEALRALRERAEATLSNLVAASKTHAQSAGMAPVSLLDAAASHVSASVTELGKTVCIRKATKSEQEQFAPPPTSSYGNATNGYSPALRSVDEGKSSTHQRFASSTSSRRGDGSSPSFSRAMESPRATSSRPSLEERRRPPSEPSSSTGSSPPPIFDQPPRRTGGIGSDDSAIADGSEDAWAELKPYLEAQTESIVYAIQSVLSGVRSPTPSPTLNENLTQIITIVSSIVAVCNDNLPPASAQQGNEILRELGEHANRLSEVQAQKEVTKESRQVMAKSSFAVANAMKGLMKLQ
ncbi:hypothetical protein PLICRDRAFT_34713 [Plicaturopsis crispa FD-325 SS-3]|nr:hypothetical protein PLICRDRAFT_34713 [Plicaturopsis crispa FD-325 SS-3]